MPFSQNQWLPPAAAVFSSFPLLVGLQLLLKPNSGLDMLDYKLPQDKSFHSLVQAFVRYFGARDLTLGLIQLAIWRSGNKQLLGTTVLIGSGLATMDGFINRLDVPGGEWKHWVFVPIGLIISGGLLGTFDSLL